jgi:hypothetical protein
VGADEPAFDWLIVPDGAFGARTPAIATAADGLPSAAFGITGLAAVTGAWSAPPQPALSATATTIQVRNVILIDPYCGH